MRNNSAVQNTNLQLIYTELIRSKVTTPQWFAQIMQIIHFRQVRKTICGEDFHKSANLTGSKGS